jgi:hypothetical protein
VPLSAAEADSQTTDPSVCGVRISDLITERTFATVSPDAASECADGRTLTGTADVYTFCTLPLDVAWHSPKSRVI